MDWVSLAFMTLLSATIQSATGFGFGLIAVPLFLIILASTDAIQMVMIIILFMSLLDWFKLRGQSSSRILWALNSGMLLGFPVGLFVFQQLNLSVLKLVIALIIMVFSVFSVYQMLLKRQPIEKNSQDTNNLLTVFVGFVSGSMTTSLAMPGPSVMMYLMQQQINKTTIRATILTYFIFAYAGAIAVQTFTVGIAANTWINSLVLVPIALMGVFLGHIIAPKLNQKLFKYTILSLLTTMSFVMLFQL